MGQQEFSFRRSANAVVVAPDGKLMVLVCSEWLDRPDRSLKPDLVGGRVEAGETVMQGLAREIMEESGLRIYQDSINLFYQNTNQSIFGLGFWHNHYYMARSYDHNVTLSWEHGSYHWVGIEEFAATNWRPSQREPVDFMLERGLLQYYIDETIRMHNNKS